MRSRIGEQRGPEVGLRRSGVTGDGLEPFSVMEGAALFGVQGASLRLGQGPHLPGPKVA